MDKNSEERERERESNSLQSKKEHYKKEINDIEAKVYNHEQKQLALSILENANEHNIDGLFTFITQRVKLGFTFDAAPKRTTVLFRLQNTARK